MCTVSMISDHYREKWGQPHWQGPAWPGITPQYIPSDPNGAGAVTAGFVSRAEFDALRKEVEEMKALLIRAKAYDKANREPDCEMAEKVALLRAVAKRVGVDLDDVFGKEAP